MKALFRSAIPALAATRRAATVALSLCCLAVSPWVLADGYTYTSINVSGSVETNAQGINARGDIVGVYVDGHDVQRGFLLRKGVFTTIDNPDVMALEARQINARGDIVGPYVGLDDELHGFLVSDGRFTRIDHPNASATNPVGFNNAGDVVGFWIDKAGNYADYIQRDGRFSQSTIECNLRGIQDNGRVLIGTYVSDGTDGLRMGAYGCISRKRGEYELIEYPGLSFPCTAIRGINERGDVVGGFVYSQNSECYPPEGDSHGFLYRDGEFTLIEFPGAQGTDARGINDDGVIVGRYIDRKGAMRGFKAKPKD